MKRLYELAGEYATILDEITTSEGEIDEWLESRLDAIADDFTEKIENCATLIKCVEAEADAIMGAILPLIDEIETQKKRATAKKNRAARIKEYVLHQMQMVGIPKVSSPRVEVSIRRCGTPSISWAGGEIPEDYRVVSVSLDKKRAQEAVKNGETLPEGLVVSYTTYLAMR